MLGSKTEIFYKFTSCTTICLLLFSHSKTKDGEKEKGHAKAGGYYSSYVCISKSLNCVHSKCLINGLYSHDILYENIE